MVVLERCGVLEACFPFALGVLSWSIDVRGGDGRAGPDRGLKYLRIESLKFERLSYREA